jgi:hypothetical protein
MARYNSAAMKTKIPLITIRRRLRLWRDKPASISATRSMRFDVACPGWRLHSSGFTSLREHGQASRIHIFAPVRIAAFLQLA